ncbi:hypothetical protein [Amycolatopsis japonica]
MRNPVHTINPGPGPILMDPVSPTTTPHTRRRGRPALAAITSTAAFSNDGLTEPARQLVLLVLCSLVRNGTLTDAYAAVLARHGDRPGHWCHGKDLRELRHYCSKFLGKSARTAPTWAVLTDLFSATLPERECQRLLPWAAWLWCRAHDDPAPPGYTGPITPPPWGEQDVVAKTAVFAALRADVPPHLADHAPPACEPRRHEPDEDHGTPPAAEAPPPVWENPQDLRVLLDYMTQMYRSQEDEIARLTEANHVLELKNWELRTQFVKATQAAKSVLTQHDPSLVMFEVRRLLDVLYGRERASTPPLPRPRPRPAAVDHPDLYLAQAPPSA